MRNDALELFQKVFVDEFSREFEFLLAVGAGRAQGKADFTDKILSLGKSALSALNLPIPCANWLPGALNHAVDWV